MADKTTKELERIYTIPLRKVKTSPRNHRTDRAIRAVKAYLSKHMKSKEIWIDQSVNEQIWARGMYKLQSKIRVRALKFDDGVVEVTLPETDVTTSLRAEMAKRREERESEKEKKAEKKEEKPEVEKKGEGDEKAPAGEKKGEGDEKAAEKKEPSAKPAAKKDATPAPKKDADSQPAHKEADHRPAHKEAEHKPTPKKEGEHAEKEHAGKEAHKPASKEHAKEPHKGAKKE